LLQLSLKLCDVFREPSPLLLPFSHLLKGLHKLVNIFNLMDKPEMVQGISGLLAAEGA
jgi:hypothetical protein